MAIRHLRVLLLVKSYTICSIDVLYRHNIKIRFNDSSKHLDKKMSNEAQLKRARVERRIAQAAFTRVVKALEHVIANNIPWKEITAILNKLQEAFENLVRKHKEFASLVEDDEECNREEKCLVECQDVLMETETRAKISIDKMTENTLNEIKMKNWKSLLKV